MMTSDHIRKFAQETYVRPAVAKGQKEFRIRAGDVHKALTLRNRVPVVCQALESKRFLTENNLVVESKEGPPSGLSTSVVFHYRIVTEGEGSASRVSQNPSPAAGTGRNLLNLLKLKGIGKEAFAALGGGENFIRSERKAFADAIEKQDRERGLL